jgi:hypothetical protein
MVALGGDLVARYGFENDLADSSGNGHTGAVAAGAPMYVAGQTGFGQAIRIRSGDSVTWAGLPKPAAITASVRVRLEPGSPAKSWLLDEMISLPGTGWRGWQFKVEKLSGDSGYVHWILADTAGLRQTTTGTVTTLYAGQWHHLVGTHDGVSTATLYCDGQMVAQKTTSPFAPAPATTNMRLNNIADDQFYGDIDDITIHSRSLAAAEVLDLFNDGFVHPRFRVTPGEQSATALEGCASPAPTLQAYTVTNKDPSAAHTIRISEVAVDGTNFDWPWLSLGASQLIVPAGGSATLTTAIDHVTSALPAGQYTARLKFSEDSATPVDITRQIALTIIGCQFSVMPGTIRRYYFQGSALPVLPIVCTVTNTGRHGLTYSVQQVADRPWLALDRTGGGPLDYQGTSTVTVTINPAGLPVGEHTCDIRFTSNCPSSAETVVRLTLGVVDRSGLPFVLSYYDNGFKSIPVNDLAYSTLAACGMNVVNPTLGSRMAPWIDPDLAMEYGLKCMIDWDYDGLGTVEFPYNPAAIDANARFLAERFGSHPATLGYRLRDEPGADEWPQIALAHEKLLEYDPDCLPWVNILPNYSYEAYTVASHKQYIDSYMTVVQPKVLCMDEYTAVASTTYPPNAYPLYWHWSNLERFRKYGLAYHVPCWKIIESNLANTSPNTEGIYRFQTYSALAYGFTGILYFTYTTQSPGLDLALAWGKEQSGTWGSGTSKYAIAQAINSEVKALAPTLMKLTSSNVRFNTRPVFPGSSNVPAEDIETFASLTGGSYVQSISGGTAAVGEFADASNRKYLMFVNEDWVNGHSLTITLKSANIPGLGRVSKTTGRLTLASIPNAVLSLPLSAGDGELYKVLLDTSAGLAPAHLTGTVLAPRVLLHWSNSSDPQTGISYYVVYRDGREIGTSSGSAYTDITVLPESTYTYEVTAVNGEGLESGRSSPFAVTTLRSCPADLDRDGDVDEADFNLFEGCLSGPAVAYVGACSDRNLDADGDVDQSDFGLFQRCYGGQDNPPEPACAGSGA